MKTDTSAWHPSDLSNTIHLNPDILEFQDNKGEWHDFVVMATPTRLVFGGYCNVGFLESGYLLREDGESLDSGLSELLADLETYYNDGPQFVGRIVYNERM